MHSFARYFFTGCLVCVSLVTLASADVEIERVSMGWDGFYKRMRWVPVQVTVRSEGETFEGNLKIQYLDPYSGKLLWTASQPLELSFKSRRTVRFSPFVYWLEAKLRCQLEDSEGRIRARLEPEIYPPLHDSQMLIFVITSERQGIHTLDGLPIDGGEVRLAYGRLQELPYHSSVYGSLDAVILHEGLAPQRLNSRQQEALLEWIASGGAFLSIPEQRPHVLSQWMPLTQIQQRIVEKPIQIDEPITFRTNHWLTGRIHDAARSILSIEGDPVFAERRFEDGRILFLGVSAAQIDDGWEYILRTLRTSAQKAWSKTSLRRHERRIRSILIRQRDEGTPLTIIITCVGVVLMLGITTICWGKTPRRITMLLIVIWSLGVSGTSLVVAYRKEPTLAARGVAWCQLYPQIQRMEAHVVGGLHVSRAARITLPQSRSWLMRPLQWQTPADLVYHQEENQIVRAELQLSPWKPRPFLFDGVVPYPYGIKLTGDQLQSDLPIDIEDVYVLSTQGWSSIGSLPSQAQVPIEWRPLGRWRLPTAFSSLRASFWRILIEERVLSVEEERPIVIGWTKIRELDLSDLPVEIEGDALLLIHAGP